jgi:hypothetical protein
MNALGVVVNGNRQLAFGGFLPDYVLIQEIFDLQRLGDLVGAGDGGLRLIVFQYRVAYSDALVADVSALVITGRRD